MAEILQADLDALRGLGKALTGRATAIAGLEIDARTTMPDSPIQQAMAAVGPAALAAFGALKSNIEQMAAVTNSGVRAYSDVEQAFVEQVRTLDPPRHARVPE
ncbi:hypothetical protein DFR70_1021076 [Nocardia tenerifensis]|uniref:Excreted virulence factor EspC (Type VII ESX diderm) n=1 Tax=Nocardia tenerifensis TaxID=228006 RepID=A0A318KLQ6_9NOCA|nr:hypothetical protein [Nocardia tenerifensis]PXX69387.1 hypothetical protein DFR70_1021076 [Nocardia tenerifensis]